MNNDENHLKLLAIGHYVMGGAAALFSSMFIRHLLWGIATLRGSEFFGPPGKDAPPREFGYFLIVMGGGVVLVGWTMGACLVLAGRSLQRHTRYTFCLVVAAIACVVCNPFGTILGVFTIVVLMRPSVKELFPHGSQNA